MRVAKVQLCDEMQPFGCMIIGANMLLVPELGHVMVLGPRALHIITETTSMTDVFSAVPQVPYNKGAGVYVVKFPVTVRPTNFQEVARIEVTLYGDRARREELVKYIQTSGHGELVNGLADNGEMTKVQLFTDRAFPIRNGLNGKSPLQLAAEYMQRFKVTVVFDDDYSTTKHYFPTFPTTSSSATCASTPPVKYDTPFAYQAVCLSRDAFAQRARSAQENPELVDFLAPWLVNNSSLRSGEQYGHRRYIRVGPAQAAGKWVDAHLNLIYAVNLCRAADMAPPLEWAVLHDFLHMHCGTTQEHDGGGMQVSSTAAIAPVAKRVKLQLPMPKRPGAGLTSNGTSCFVNAAMTLLAAVSGLTTALRGLVSQGCQNAELCDALANTLEDGFSDILTRTRAHDMNNLLAILTRAGIGCNQQDDAAGFLHQLITHIRFNPPNDDCEKLVQAIDELLCVLIEVDSDDGTPTCLQVTTFPQAVPVVDVLLATILGAGSFQQAVQDSIRELGTERAKPCSSAQLVFKLPAYLFVNVVEPSNRFKAAAGTARVTDTIELNLPDFPEMATTQTYQMVGSATHIGGTFDGHWVATALLNNTMVTVNDESVEESRHFNKSAATLFLYRKVDFADKFALDMDMVEQSGVGGAHGGIPDVSTHSGIPDGSKGSGITDLLNSGIPDVSTHDGIPDGSKHSGITDLSGGLDSGHSNSGDLEHLDLGDPSWLEEFVLSNQQAEGKK